MTETAEKMSIREWLCTQTDETTGLPLARPGKGRFSRAAQAKVAEAYANGMTFTDDDPKPEKVAKTRVKRVVSDATPKVTAPERDYDMKHVRKWCAENGISVGDRGRIKAEILVQYDAANPAKAKIVTAGGGSVATSAGKTVSTPVRDRVRPENVAYALSKPVEGHDYIQRVSIAFEKCGGCKWAIGYCTCDGGPFVPKYLGDERAMLSKP